MSILRAAARLGISVALVCTAPRAALAADANAYAVWVDHESLEDQPRFVHLSAVRIGSVRAHFSKEALAEAAHAKSKLVESLALVRRGLAAASCSSAHEGHDIRQLVDLESNVAALALLDGQAGEDFAPLITTLLAYGREVGRCGGGLMELLQGATTEAKALLLARWAEEFGLLSTAQLQSISDAAQVKPLSRADLPATLELEMKTALLELSAAKSSAAYSPEETAALSRSTSSSLRAIAAAPSLDFAAFKKMHDELLTPAERDFMRGHLADDSWTSPCAEMLAVQTRPNLIGRFAVWMRTPGEKYIRGVLSQLDENAKAQAEFISKAGRAIPRNMGWIDSGAR